MKNRSDALIDDFAKELLRNLKEVNSLTDGLESPAPFLTTKVLNRIKNEITPRWETAVFSLTKWLYIVGFAVIILLILNFNYYSTPTSGNTIELTGRGLDDASEIEDLTLVAER